MSRCPARLVISASSHWANEDSSWAWRSRRTTLPPAPVTRGRALEHLLFKVSNYFFEVYNRPRWGARAPSGAGSTAPRTFQSFRDQVPKCTKARRRWVLKVGRPPPARKAATNTPTHSQQRLLIHSVLHLGCLFVGGVLFGTLIVYEYACER